MPLGLAMHNKWDSISMAAPQLHSLRMERPAYSTPAPVENTPSNNECRMVELRGAKIASFIVGGDEFICLPQAFDLFLKHLVGGLHTVYTKLKRLSISPVVCNVEQVRILRGIGAIQPGVNRCKLITRKDFETLYQDCTTATRPGRPPKRYPMLPPTTDFLPHHSPMRSSALTSAVAASHGMLNPVDITNLHKRMRLDSDPDKQIHSFPDRRRASLSPPKISDSLLPEKDSSIHNSPDLHSNPTANFYLQAQQAFRQQYQQAASGLHNGMDAQQAAAAAAGINPALAPFMMMSHPALFSSGLPPSSMAMLNHINQFAQSHGNSNMTNAAAAAAAQIAASGGSMHQAAAAQAAAQVAAASLAAATQGSREKMEENSDNNTNDEKYSDNEDGTKNISNHEPNQGVITNGFGSDGRASPASSMSDGGGSHLTDSSERALSVPSESGDSIKGINGEENERMNTNEQNRTVSNSFENHDHKSVESDILRAGNSPDSVLIQHQSAINAASMQTLLTNIQGLLKVAADNARLQEKQNSFEIAEIKLQLTKERQIREDLKKKLQETEKAKDEAMRKFKRERKSRKYYQDQLAVIQPQLARENSININKDSSVNLSPPLSEADGMRTSMENGASLTTYRRSTSPSATSDQVRGENTTSNSVINVAQEQDSSQDPCISPSDSSSLHNRNIASPTKSSCSTSNSNNNNLSSSSSRSSPVDHLHVNDNLQHPRTSSTQDNPSSVAMDNHGRKSSDHLPVADSRMFFKSQLLFQTTASQ